MFDAAVTAAELALQALVVPRQPRLDVAGGRPGVRLRRAVAMG
jgi:hypothetical protein